MDQLSQRDYDHIFGLLSSKEACYASCVCKNWGMILTKKSTRIWQPICNSEFGGPLPRGVTSWRAACRLFTKEYQRHCTNQTVDVHVMWAMSNGHLSFLSRAHKEGKLDLTQLKEPNGIMRMAVRKASPEAIAWCIQAKLTDMTKLTWAKVISSSDTPLKTVPEEVYFHLLEVAKIELDQKSQIIALLSGLIRSNRISIVSKHLVAMKVPLSALDCHSLVSQAIDTDNSEALKVLEEYCLRDGKEKWQQTLEVNAVLSRCATLRKFKCFNWLLEHDASLAATDSSGFRAIHCACTKDDISGIPFIELLICKYGEDVNRLTDLRQYSLRRTPLHVALERNEIGCIEYLIEHGADLEVHTHHPGEVSPVLFATHEMNVLNLLLDKGINATTINANGTNVFLSFLSHAISNETTKQNDFPNSHLQLFKRLMDLGVSPTHQDEYGRNAALLSHPLPLPLLEWILDNGGIDVNTRDVDGFSILMIACRQFYHVNADYINILLTRGARVNDIDEHGANALYYACMRDNSEIVRILLEHGAKQLTTTKYTQGTPLHQANSNGNLDIVKLLVEAGGDVHATDTNGRTLLDCAHPSIVEYLTTLTLQKKQQK